MCDERVLWWTAHWATCDLQLPDSCAIADSTLPSRSSCSVSPVTAHTFKEGMVKEGMATEFSERFCSGAEGVVESSESRQLSCRGWLGLCLDGTEQSSGKLRPLWGVSLWQKPPWGEKKGSKSGVEGVGGREKGRKKKISLRWAVCCILVGNTQVEIYSLNELQAEKPPERAGSEVPHCPADKGQGNAWGRWAGCRGGQHCCCSLHAKGQKLPHAVLLFLNNNLERFTSSFSPQHHTPTNAILINISTLEKHKRYFDLILLYFLKLLFFFFPPCIFVSGRSVVVALMEG